MRSRKVRVVRDGRENIIEARDLVPGDILLLAAGNAVGGYVVTERMLEMFKSSGAKKGGGSRGAH